MLNPLAKSASEGRIGPGSYDAPTAFGPRSFAPVFRIIPPPRDAWRKVEDIPPPGRYNPGFRLLERKVSTPSIRKDNIGRVIDHNQISAPKEEKKPDPGQYFVMKRVGTAGEGGPAYTISPESVSAQEAVASRMRHEAGPPPGTYNPKSLGLPRPRTALLRLSEQRTCDLASPIPGAIALARPDTPGPGAYVPPSSFGATGPSFSFSYTSRFDFTAAAANQAAANGGATRRQPVTVLVRRVATRRAKRPAGAGEAGEGSEAGAPEGPEDGREEAPEAPAVDYVEENKEVAARYTAGVRRSRIEASAAEVEERIRQAQERKAEQLAAFLRHKAVIARRAFRDEALVAREKRQREWTLIVAHAARLRVFCTAVNRARQERREQERLQARMRFVRRFAMKWWTRVRLRHAEQHMKALSKFVQLARIRMRIVRKRKAAGVLADFFSKMAELGEVTRAVKSLLSKVRLLQRTWRDFKAVGEGQVRLLRLQWDALGNESDDDDEAAGPGARTARKRKPKKPGAPAPVSARKKPGLATARSPSRARPKRGQAAAADAGHDFDVPIGVKYSVIKESLRARRKKHVAALNEWAARLPQLMQDCLRERRRRELMGEENVGPTAEEREAAADRAADVPSNAAVIKGIYEPGLHERTALEIATDRLPPRGPAGPSGSQTARRKKELRINAEEARERAAGETGPATRRRQGGRSLSIVPPTPAGAHGAGEEAALEPLTDATWWARAMRMDSRHFERHVKEDPARRLPPSMRAPLFFARLNRLQLEKLVAFAQTYAREMAHFRAGPSISVNFSVPSGESE